MPTLAQMTSILSNGMLIQNNMRNISPAASKYFTPNLMFMGPCIVIIF